MYFKQDLERDFLKAYKRVLNDFGNTVIPLSQRELVARVIYGGAPRFYITYEMARRNVSGILRGMPYECKNKLKREMYNDIARLTVEYRARHKRYRDDFNSALMAVLSEYPAPRFYLNEKSAYNMLCTLLRRQRKEKYQQLKKCA